MGARLGNFLHALRKTRIDPEALPNESGFKPSTLMRKQRVQKSFVNYFISPAHWIETCGYASPNSIDHNKRRAV